jgi:hypothetical protein
MVSQLEPISAGINVVKYSQTEELQQFALNPNIS